MWNASGSLGDTPNDLRVYEYVVECGGSSHES